MLSLKVKLTSSVFCVLSHSLFWISEILYSTISPTKSTESTNKSASSNLLLFKIISWVGWKISLADQQSLTIASIFAELQYECY